jgi:hypothetical protein
MIVTLVATEGCNLLPEYTPRIVDAPRLEQMPSHTLEQPIALGAEPYWQRDRQVEVFDDDLGSAGILAVLVCFENRDERTLLARPSDVLLRLPDGVPVSPAGPSSVASRLEHRSAYVLANGVYYAYRTNVAIDQARSDREADLVKKGLPERRLGRGKRALGFVFFVLPSTVEPFTEATLEVRFVDVEEGSSFVVSLPLVLHDPEETRPNAE